MTNKKKQPGFTVLFHYAILSAFVLVFFEIVLIESMWKTNFLLWIREVQFYVILILILKMLFDTVLDREYGG